MGRWTVALAVTGVVVSGLGLVNCSALAHRDGAQPRLLAHRGVHQPISREGLGRDTCTAAQALPVDHGLLENTLPSMEAAFAAGAGVVELDVHPTTDGQLAVFHDWTVDCRTDGTGTVRSFSMDELRRLDIAHGYTHDGGQSFPLRGTGRGLMPSLEQVFDALPAGRFLVNIKSRDTTEIDLLHALLERRPELSDRVWGIYGDDVAVARAAALWPTLPRFSKSTVKACAVDYLLTGWTGRVPDSCRDTVVALPTDLAWLAWGWPHRFTARMRGAGTEVILMGPRTGGGGSTGIDALDQLDEVPEGFDGWVWTNRVERIGPAVAARQ